jgi:DNA-binding PadR family transcriptional regulator
VGGDEVDRPLQAGSGRRAKVYSLTRAGRKRLDDETTQWTRRAAAVARLLKAEA